ncbi:MAG TPA: cytochrome c [Sphingomicrobium sp.]|nr:cytochrome c [Sphingomicrobium sp.]
MALQRGFSWTAALAGAAAMLLLLLLAGAAIAFGGLYPVAASKPDPAGIGPILHETMERGIKRSARGLVGPRLSAADVLEGGSHFKGMCQQCHGGPGAERDEFAAGMNPRPPDLAKTQGEWTREEIFWIAKHGIKMSGMPAFGNGAPDDELWKVAAFVKQLPKVSASRYASLPNAHAQEGTGEEAGHSHSHSHSH